MPIQQLQSVQASTDGETLFFLVQPVGEEPSVFHSAISSEKLTYWQHKIKNGEVWADIDYETRTISSISSTPPDWIAIHNPSNSIPPANLTDSILKKDQSGELIDQVTFIEHQFKDAPLTRLDLFKVLQEELQSEDKFRFGLTLLAARIRARKQIINTLQVSNSG